MNSKEMIDLYCDKKRLREKGILSLRLYMAELYCSCDQRWVSGKVFPIYGTNLLNPSAY